MDAKKVLELTKELKFHARGLKMPMGAAEVFIDRTVAAVSKKMSGKAKITEADLKREVSRELKKYSADLAYVYQNYDKII